VPGGEPTMSRISKSKVSDSIVSAKTSYQRPSQLAMTVALLLFVAVAIAGTRALADSTTQAQALRIVNQYAGTFTSAATCCTSETPSGPLMGNGNVGVVVVNPIDTMSFLFGKNEFWSLSGGTVEPMAAMSLSVSGMSGASFAMQENIGTGEVCGQFALNGNQITTTSWMQANDTINNMFFTQFNYAGSGSQTVTVSLAPGNGNTYPTSTGSSGSVLYINVAADSASTYEGYNTHQVRVAVNVLGATGTISNNQLTFTLLPGTPVTLVSSIMSNYDSSNYLNESIANVSSITQSRVADFNSAHTGWWSNFWSQSYIEIPDKTIEKEYYGSLYLLASVSRANTAPPGLWGPWVEEMPAWNGDYTLNYNYETPFYAAFPTNHVALADSFDAPVINWVPNAEGLAASNGWTGAFYRVHIGPLPNGSNDTSIHNQKFNGAYAATVMLQHYYYTADPVYAAAIWPTIEEMTTFWQNYLSWNGTSYDILEDAQQEDDAYPQTDGVMSLGLVRNLLQGAITLSSVLNENSSQRATWQYELDNLATFNGLPFPTFTQNGLQVFEWTSVGRQWDTNNSIGIQHIYPGNQIGGASTSTLLTISQNMISEMCCSPYGDGWADQNGADTFYPAAARVGYSPSTILSNLDNWINGNTYPNLHIHTAGGGMENFNTVPSTVAEMLMQSFQGNIILFQDWPSGTNAHFGDMLAYGNFLVSSEILNNAVQYVRIISQAGQTVSVTNPWPGQQAQFYRNGTSEGTLSGATFSITTSVGDVLILGPSGSSYSSLASDLTTPLATSSDTPYTGTPVAIPGTVLMENYDKGGQGIAYSVNAINGTDNGYRPDGIDLETTSAPGGGNDIGWTNAGQWFNYTVNVATAGTYVVTFEVAAPNAVTDGFHLADAGGVNLSGPVNVPSTGGWQTWTTVTANVVLPAGQQVLTIFQDNGGFNLYTAAIAAGATFESPYTGTAVAIPGTVLAQNYDKGGLGVGYNVDSVNGTDNGYRSDGVDLEATSAPGGGNDIGWTSTGQWFNYTVNVATAGRYAVTFEVAAPNAVADGFHVANSAGVNLTGSVNIPSTGGFETWTTMTAGLELQAGQQVLTIFQDNGGFNIYSAAFVQSASVLPYNVYAIYANGTSYSTGGIDGADSLSATLLGSSVTWNGTTLTYGTPNQPDGFSGVTIALPEGTYGALNLLALAVNGSQTSQTFTVTYSDNSTYTFTQSISDWCSPQSYSGESEVVTMAYRNTATGGEVTSPTCYVYGYTIPVNSSKTVSSLTLPSNNHVVVLAVQPVTLLPYNVYAIYTNGTSYSTGGIDGANSLSATLLGSSATWNGTTLTYGTPNQPDGFSDVTIPLAAGSYSSLNMLALAVNGSQASQTFIVTYSDNSTSTFTQSISDWCSPQSYSGESEVVAMAYRNTSTGGELTSSTCYVYGYTIPVNSAKTVSSLSLPSNHNVVVLTVQDQ
jgi:alpha-L-fucosidase 2